MRNGHLVEGGIIINSEPSKSTKCRNCHHPMVHRKQFDFSPLENILFLFPHFQFSNKFVQFMIVGDGGGREPKRPY